MPNTASELARLRAALAAAEARAEVAESELAQTRAVVSCSEAMIQEPVKMLAFASGKFAQGLCPNLEGAKCRGVRGELVALNILRISEEDYRGFLNEWVAWLGETGIARAAA